MVGGDGDASTMSLDEYIKLVQDTKLQSGALKMGMIRKIFKIANEDPDEYNNNDSNDNNQNNDNKKHKNNDDYHSNDSDNENNNDNNNNDNPNALAIQPLTNEFETPGTTQDTEVSECLCLYFALIFCDITCFVACLLHFVFVEFKTLGIHTARKP